MWMTVKLGEVCNFQNGRAFKKSEWSESGLPIIRIQNLKNEKTEHNFYEGEYDERIYVENGDLLLSWSGTVKPFIWCHGDALLNQHVFKVSVSTQLDQGYAFYLFQNILDEISKQKVGIGLQHITKKAFENFPITLPPLAEQQRIVAKLDAAFAEIDRAVELANENLHLAEQSTESFLTDIIINSDNICHKRLGDACEFSQGVQVPKPEQSETLSDEHSQRFLRIIDFTSEGMEPPRYISQKGKKYHMTENDVALVRYGNPGFVCRGLKGILANNLFKVIPRTDELDNSYLYYFLKSGLFQRAIRLKAHGVAMQAISFSLISDIELLLPPTELQEKIVKKAEAIEATLLELEGYYRKKLDLLERLKSSLLAQELQPPQSEAA